MTLLCISDICAWFSEQGGATRLDTVLSLLQMLCPLELQFVGVCVDDLTRRDQHCLRDVEQRFNVPDIVARLTDLNDRRCRASLIVAMSLLKASNHATATAVYQILLSFYLVYQQLPRTKDVIDEIMLLLTMAKHHPAFRFEQRTSITGLFDEVFAFVASGEKSSAMLSFFDDANGHLAHPNEQKNGYATDAGAILIESETVQQLKSENELQSTSKSDPHSLNQTTANANAIKLNYRSISTQTSIEDFTAAFMCFSSAMANNSNANNATTADPTGSSSKVQDHKKMAQPETADDEAAHVTNNGSLVVNTSGSNSHEEIDLAQDKKNPKQQQPQQQQRVFKKLDAAAILSPSFTRHEPTDLTPSPGTISFTESKRLSDQQGKSISTSSSLDALLLASSLTSIHEQPSATLSSTASNAMAVAAAAATSSDVECRRGASSSSTEASIRLPPAAAVAPVAQLASLPPPQDYVPRELYLLLRERELLHLKKFFAKMTLNEIVNLSIETSPDRFALLSPDDRNTVLFILDILRKQLDNNSLASKYSRLATNVPRNGLTTPNSSVVAMDNLLKICAASDKEASSLIFSPVVNFNSNSAGTTKPSPKSVLSQKTYMRAASLPANNDNFQRDMNGGVSSPKSNQDVPEGTLSPSLNQTQQDILTDSAILAKELAFSTGKQQQQHSSNNDQNLLYNQNNKPPLIHSSHKPFHGHVYQSSTLPYSSGYSHGNHYGGHNSHHNNQYNSFYNMNGSIVNNANYNNSNNNTTSSSYRRFNNNNKPQYQKRPSYNGNNRHYNGGGGSSYMKPPMVNNQKDEPQQQQQNLGMVESSHKQQWTYNEEDFPPVHNSRDSNPPGPNERVRKIVAESLEESAQPQQVQLQSSAANKSSSTSLPASKSQSPSPNLNCNIGPTDQTGAKVAPPSATPPAPAPINYITGPNTTGAATTYHHHHRSPPATSMGVATSGAFCLASALTPPPPGTMFKQQQPIRCLQPTNANNNNSNTNSNISPPPSIGQQQGFASGPGGYAPTLPPPVAYNFQGAGYPFFAAVFPPPAQLRFMCPPMSLPPPPHGAQGLAVCAQCNSVVAQNNPCHACLTNALRNQQQQHSATPLVD